MNAYELFLSVCGFEKYELDKYVPQLKAICKHWQIGERQLQQAATQHIPQYYDISLKGIQKILGAYIREWIRIESIDVKETFVVYANVPSAISALMALKHCGGNKIFVGTPDFICMLVVYGLIGIDGQIEPDGLSRCYRHCALNRLRMYAAKEGVIPNAHVMWTWGTLCDHAVKTDEMIQIRYNRHHKWICTALPHDSTNEGVQEENRTEYLTLQIHQALMNIERICGISLAEDDFVAAQKDWNRLNIKVQLLGHMIASAQYVPIGSNETALAQCALLTMFNTGTEYIEKAIDLLTEELRARLKQKKDVRNALRLACYFTPICVPYIGRLFEKNGMALIFNTAFLWRSIVKPKKDPYNVIAAQWMGMLIGQSAEAEATYIVEIIKRFHLDGMVLGMFSFDRYLGGHQNLLRRIIEERTKKPVLCLEINFWENGLIFNERTQTVIESFSHRLKK